MKLLFFASDYTIGLSCLLVQQAIAINKTEIELLCLAGDTEQEKGLAKQMQANQVELLRIENMDVHENFNYLSKQIGQIINDNKIEVVHVQNNWQLALVSFYKYRQLKPKNFKIAYTLHGFRHNHPIKSIIAIAMIGSMLKLFANRVFIMSEYVRKHFVFLGSKMRKLYLGIDSSFFEKKDNSIEIGQLRLIFPGQFRKGKNQQIIINAIASYIEETEDRSIELYLPGEGPLLDNYKQLAREKGIESNIIFPGQCSKLEIQRLYEHCNVGVVSSNTETFGQSIVEPFVLGRCVLSRDVGVARDIIKDGINGYIFDDSESLTRILKKISSNKNLLREIGDNNFQNRDIFRWSEIVKQYKESLSRLIK